MTITRISAGSNDLDKWLTGGYETDIITTIYGPAGSGKTNFCVLAGMSQAKKGGKVIFVDTEGGFSVERFKQVAGEGYEKILKNVLLLKPTTFSEQEKAFDKLLKEIKNARISLVIIDGMTMLYRLELAEARKEDDKSEISRINSKLARQMRILAEIARTRKIPVLITNQVYSDFGSGVDGGVHMVGGDILKYWSKCIIELQSKYGKRKAVMRKHRSLPEKELNFVINMGGVGRRGIW